VILILLVSDIIVFYLKRPVLYARQLSIAFPPVKLILMHGIIVTAFSIIVIKFTDDAGYAGF
jgi:hypothetical protein